MARNLPSTDEHSDITGRSPVVRTAGALADSTAFNVFIFGIILANAVVLGLETYDSIERDHGDLLGLLNDIFLGIFVVELAVRLTAYGSKTKDFFRNGWNVFDFIDEGLDVSNWTVPFFASYVLFAALLVLNILIGVVMNSPTASRSSARALSRGPLFVHESTPAPRWVNVASIFRPCLDELERDLRGRGGGF